MRRIRQNIISLDKSATRKLFRPAISRIIVELKQTGTIEALDELIQLTPAGLFEMMKVKGLGPKKLLLLWRKAKIDTVQDLLKACKQDKLKGISGFGPKVVASIIASIESVNLKKTYYHYAQLARLQKDWLQTFKKKQRQNSYLSRVISGEKH